MKCILKLQPLLCLFSMVTFAVIHAAAAPSITSYSPTEAVAGAPAFVLTIEGTGFDPDAAAQWNGSLLATTVVSGTQLTAAVPATLIASPGIALVTVTSGGAASNSVTFNVVAPPSVVSVTPSQVDAGGPAFTLTLTGSGFVSGAKVTWSGATLATTFVSSTQLTATVPAALTAISGKFSLVVTNPDGTVSNSWTQMYVQPVLTQFSPTTAPTGSSQFVITATGMGFSLTDTLRIGVASSHWTVPTNVSGSTFLIGQIPAAALAVSGTAAISVVDTANGASSRTLPFTIAPAAPTLYGLIPNSITGGGPDLTLQVNGTLFLPGSTVQWNGSPLTTTLVNSGELTAVVPASLTAHPGQFAVAVAVPGAPVSAALSFSVVPIRPTITSWTVGNLSAGDPGFSFTVNGTNFVPGSAVEWNYVKLATTYVNSTQLTASLPANMITAGVVLANVTNPDGGVSNSISTIVSAFSVTSLLPQSVTSGGAPFTLTVNGSGFHSGAIVQWNGTALNTTFVSGVQLTAIVPAAQIAMPGLAAISVVNTGGAAIGKMYISVIAPTPPVIIGAAPAIAKPGGPAFTLTVIGAGFVSGSRVQWNGSPLSTTFTSATDLAASVPAAMIASPGSASILVINPDGTTSAPFVYTIAATGGPQIQTHSAIPSTGSPGFTLTVTGSGFVSGSMVRWNTTLLNTTFTSSTQLTAAVPAALIAAPGPVSLTVINPDGAVAPPISFTLGAAVPTLTSISPSNVKPGTSDFTMALIGSGFGTLSYANLGGTPWPATFLSTTQMSMIVPARMVANPTTLAIFVVNGTAQSNPLLLTVGDAAGLGGVFPNQITAGSPSFSLEASGLGFVPGSTINWNGSPLATSFLSTTELTAFVPASLIASPGTASITVTEPNGVPSTPVTFTINSDTLTISTLSPAEATEGGPSFTLTVNGTGFVPGCGVQWILPMSTATLATSFISATQLSATVPASLIADPNTVSLAVAAPDGTVSSPVSFLVKAIHPYITSIGPGSITVGSPGFTLTLMGVDFQPGAVVKWNGSPLPTTAVTAGLAAGQSELSATVAANLVAAPGTASVTVVNPGGDASPAFQFPIVSNPVISDLGPGLVTAGGPGFALTLHGSGFVAGSLVQWNATALVTTSVSAFQISAAVPASFILNPGTARISVLNPNGLASNSLSVTINAAVPTIDGLHPSSAPAGGAQLSLQISGTGFLPGAVVEWNGTPLVTSSLSFTEVSATVPASLTVNPGTARVTVVNPGGSSSGIATFTVTPPPPVIGSFSPWKVAAGTAAFSLRVQGSGFDSGTVVLWNGSSLSTQVVNSEQLTASVASNLVSGVSTARITIVNSSGTASGAAQFLIDNMPVVQSVAPAAVTSGGPAVTLTVLGAAFQPDAAVQWNYSTIPTTYVSPTELTAVVQASLMEAPGAARVSVRTSFGSSNGQPVRVSKADPTIGSLQPNSASPGGAGFTVTVSGAGYLPGATVQWDGIALGSTYKNSGEVQAVVPASLIASAGTAQVAVANPNGTVSATANFLIRSTTAVNIQSGGVVNAANPQSPIAPGSLVSIYGTGMGPQTGTVASPVLPTALDGTSVFINDVPAPLLYVSNSQLNVQVPFEISVGSATLVVQTTSGTSSPVRLPVTATGPGVFQMPLGNHALAQNGADSTINSPQDPAKPGEHVILYLTGQGLVDNPVADGLPATSSPFSVPLAPVQVTIGGAAAAVSAARLAPHMVGVLQLDVIVPAVPDGDQNVEVIVGGMAANTSLISVQTN